MRCFRIRRVQKKFFVTISLQKYRKWLIFEVRRFLAPLLIFAVIMSALISFSGTDFSWTGWELTTGFPNKTFCEDIGGETVRQPANAWSSILFITIGLWAARRSELDNIPSIRLAPIRRHKRYGLIFGTALILTGIGSWFFHASLTYVGHFVDVAGMYLLGGFLFTYALSRKLGQGAGAFLVAYFLVTVPLILLQWFQPEASRYAFGALIASSLTFEIVWHSSLKNWYFIAALASLLFGFGIWILDEKKVLCSPYSALQGHAVWHILTAISTQLSYLYYRSERPRSVFKIGHRPWERRFRVLP